MPVGQEWTRTTAYLYVDDADHLAEEWRAAGAEVHGPEDTEGDNTRVHSSISTATSSDSAPRRTECAMDNYSQSCRVAAATVGGTQAITGSSERLSVDLCCVRSEKLGTVRADRPCETARVADDELVASERRVSQWQRDVSTSAESSLVEAINITVAVGCETDDGSCPWTGRRIACAEVYGTVLPPKFRVRDGPVLTLHDQSLPHSEDVTKPLDRALRISIRELGTHG